MADSSAPTPPVRDEQALTLLIRLRGSDEVMREVLWRAILTGGEYTRQYQVVVEALEKERREALEEAAKAVCEYCRDGYPLTSERARHRTEIGSWVWCAATPIRRLREA